MNTHKLASKLTTLLSLLDMNEARDELLGVSRGRRRGLFAASALGLVGIGAVGALAAVAFLPTLRRIVIDLDRQDGARPKKADPAAASADKRSSSDRTDPKRTTSDGVDAGHTLGTDGAGR